MKARAPNAYRRLIVDVCHGAADPADMHAAAELARFLGLDLHCLFVEDEAVMALAALPFAREIRLPTHQWAALNADTVAREFRSAADATRKLLGAITKRLGVPVDLEVLRGDPAACIAARCRTGDIVLVLEPGSAAAQTTYGAMRVLAAAHQSAASVLLLPKHFKPRTGPVVAVLTDAADASLPVACGIAATTDDDLVVLLAPPVKADAAKIKDRTHGLDIPDERITVHHLHDAGADGIVGSLSGRRKRLIVMARTVHAAKDIRDASKLAAMLGVPVLLTEAEPRAGHRPA